MPTHEYCLTLDILRHGQCVDGHVFRGSSDVSLTEQGMKNMRLSCQNMIAIQPEKKPPWQKIITSPLKRCCDFATILSHQYAIPIETNSDLEELHFGDWEGQKIEQVWQHETESVNIWMQNPTLFTPKNGEPFNNFYTRVKQFLTAFSAYNEQGQDQHILIVTHGGVIRCILAHILSLPPTQINLFDVPYAAISQVKFFISPDQTLIKIMYVNGVQPCLN